MLGKEGTRTEARMDHRMCGSDLVGRYKRRCKHESHQRVREMGKGKPEYASSHLLNRMTEMEMLIHRTT